MQQKLIFIVFWLMMISNFDIYGQHEKEKGQRMNADFGYEDCACSVKIDLTIHNGLNGMYGGQAVADGLETSKGAVTVANLNDTDGDGTVDNIDNHVIGGVGGRDEVDLMKLEISSLGVLVPTCPDLELILQGPIKLWQKSSKEIMQSNIIPIASLPLTIWVEAINYSSSVRDISIQAVVDGVVKDEVKATSVWVNFVKKYKIKANSGIENSSGTSLGIIEPALINLIDNLYVNISNERYGLGESAHFNPLIYSGGCPTGNYAEKNSGYSANILTEYEIFPNNLRSEPMNLGVKFDFARQLDSDEEIIFHSDYRWRNSPDVPDENYVYGIEGSNDDGGNFDEDLTITEFNKIYSFDAPGFLYEGYFNPRDLMENHIAYWKRDLDFKEFARISFDEQPIGDGMMVQGSRCSDYIDWITNYTIVRTPLAGVSDPYLPCNHIYSQVNTAISHSAIVRLIGTSTPNINISIEPSSTNAVYQFLYNESSNQWTLRKGDSTGLITLGPFNFNPITNKWVLLDPSNVEIEIDNSSTLMNGDTFRFVVNNSIVNNILD